MSSSDISEKRDQEIEEKITKYTEIARTKVTIKTTYRSKKRNRFGIAGWFIIGSHALALTFFSLLFICSYIPQTKKIVSIVMP